MYTCVSSLLLPCSVKVPGGCIKDSYCTGDSEDCPNNRRVNGVHCQWYVLLQAMHAAW